MSDAESECPARTVYDILTAEPALTAQRYQALIDALRPTWVEDVVCPVNLAVGHLRAAVEAVAADAPSGARARHEAARTYLYQALANARLLTLEERLQEVVVEDLLGGPSSSPAGSDAHVLQGWSASRRSHGG